MQSLYFLTFCLFLNHIKIEAQNIHYKISGEHFYFTDLVNGRYNGPLLGIATISTSLSTGTFLYSWYHTVGSVKFICKRFAGSFALII